MNHYEKLKQKYLETFYDGVPPVQIAWSEIDLREVMRLLGEINIDGLGIDAPFGSDLYIYTDTAGLNIDLTKTIREQDGVCEKLCEIIGIE
jgi:hypothetical protein